VLLVTVALVLLAVVVLMTTVVLGTNSAGGCSGLPPRLGHATVFPHRSHGLAELGPRR
jgi:hypothetical protein